MKKLLLTLLAVLLAVVAFAESTTVVFSDLGFEDRDDVTLVKVDELLTLTFAEGEGFRDAGFFEDDPGVRFFCGNTLSVSLSAGSITDIVFYTAGGNYDFSADKVAVDCGSMTFGEATASWTGDARTVVFSNTAESGNIRISKMVVTFTAGASKSVEMPLVSLVENDYDFCLEMTCATDGAQIHYTLDGSEPTSESPRYTAPVQLWATTQVKAIAYKDGEDSDVAVFNAVVPEFLPDFSALPDLENSSVLIKAPMTVAYQSGRYIFLACGNMFTMVMNAFNLPLPELENGSVIKRLEGRVAVLNGQVQIIPTAVGDVSSGKEIKPNPVASVEYLQSLLSHYLMLEHVDITGVAADKAVIKDMDGNELTLNNIFGISGVDNGSNLNITGFPLAGDEGVEFAPVKIEQATKVFTDPDDLSAIREFEGSYVWEHYDFGLEGSQQLKLDFLLSNLHSGEFSISGTAATNFSFTIKAYYDPQQSTLTIHPHQQLGEDRFGDMQYFYIKDDIEDNGPSQSILATVGTVTGRRITFPTYDVWAIADPADEELGYWLLAYRNEIYKRSEPIDVESFTWAHYSTALFEDGWVTPSFAEPADCPWVVEVEQALENPALLRVVSPFMASGSSFNGLQGYIVMSVEEPDFVKVYPEIFSGYVHLETYPLNLFNIEGFMDMLGYDRKSIEEYQMFKAASTFEEQNRVITINNCRYNMPGSGKTAHIWVSDSGVSLADKMVARIHLDYDPSSLISTEADGATVQYFNLQGIPVSEPASGVYIRRCGDKVTKVIKR